MDSQSWDARYASADSVWSLEPNQFVVEYLRDLSSGSMIDVAGGEGRNALWFAMRGWHVENVDFSQVALNRFLQRADDADVQGLCTATCADVAREVEFSSKDVDLGVIAYLHNLKQTLTMYSLMERHSCWFPIRLHSLVKLTGRYC